MSLIKTRAVCACTNVPFVFFLPCGMRAVIQCHKLQTHLREKAQLCQRLRNERDKAVESLREQGTSSLTQLKGNR